MRLALLVGGALAMLACDSAPSNPTWRSDVKDIIQANCIKCHGRIARGGAPSGSRFDRYPVVRESGPSFAGFLASRTGAEDASFRMPPEIPLSDVQIETIQNWADNGGPLGDPDPDNSLPEILIDGFVGDEATVTLPYVIRDDDFDVVFGTLAATPLGGGDDIIIADDLHSGVGEVAWFIAAVQTGTYEITAVLDDDHEARQFDLGRFTIERADSNTAPTLAIQSPQPNSTIDDELEITFTIADPDVGDTNDVVFTLVRGDQVIPVTIVADAPIGPTTVTIDSSGFDEGVGFRLVAAVGLSTTSVGPITIRHGGN